MSEVRLTHIDGKLPNLALMKLAHWHKAQGDRVTLARTPSPSMFEPVYDLVYGSSIFQWSSGKVVRALGDAFPDAVIGGTGTDSAVTVEQTLGVTLGDDAHALERTGRELLKRTQLRAMLVTRGSRGMALFEPGRPTQHISIYGTDEVADVTGAGDTVIATMAMALSVGASASEAALLANYAGGLVVMKRGTATLSGDELQQAVATDLASG